MAPHYRRQIVVDIQTVARMIAALLFALVYGALAVYPRPCCVSEKFSGTVLQLDASLPVGSNTPNIHDNIIYINYAWDNRMVAIESHALNTSTNQRAKTNIYNNYHSSQQFIFSEDGHCYVKHLDPDSMTPHCLPETMTYGGSYKLGSSANYINTDVFMGAMHGTNIAVHVTHDDCTPVAQNSYGTNAQVHYISNWVYADMKQNHNTVGAFDMPHACNHPIPLGATSNIGKRDIEDAYVDLNLPHFF